MEVLRLDPGNRVLDLGCGTGDHVAWLADRSVRALGVDRCPARIAAARDTWTGHERAAFARADAVDALAAYPATFDAIVSIFGAAWFVEPRRLLPAVLASLRPGGRFAVSQPIAPHLSGGHRWCVPDEQGRWDLPPRTWQGLLREHGFLHPTVTRLAATRDYPLRKTMLVVAVRAR